MSAPEDAAADALAREVAERAIALASANAEKAQELAVQRAVRDANVDRDLRDHDKQLAQMAKSLDGLQAAFEEMTTSTRAVAKYVAEQTKGQYSKRTLWVAGAAAVATWLAIIATLLTRIF